MLKLRLLDPARVRADGRRLLVALGASLVAHGGAVALWPTGEGRARDVALLAYPATFTLAVVEPAPSGGGGPTDEAPALVEPEPSAPPPPPAIPAEPPVQDDGVPVPMAEPARPAPAPPTLVTSPPSQPGPPSSPPPRGDAAPAGSGGGSGGGTGSGTGRGVGARTGDGTGGGSGAGPPALVREPQQRARQIRHPLPVNTSETRNGLHGRARIEVLVDESGHVIEARIIERVRIDRDEREEFVSSFPAGVDEAVLSAARRAEFRPARHDGRPVRTYAVVTLAVGV